MVSARAPLSRQLCNDVGNFSLAALQIFLVISADRSHHFVFCQVSILAARSTPCINAMAQIFDFVYSQLWVVPPLPQADHTGQTVIVTGANVGLGLEAARHFTQFNARKVIVAVRNIEKGEKAKQSIEESTTRSGVVEVWQVDLSSYESVKRFAARAQGLERLDVVVENAGIATRIYRVAEDNESTISTLRLKFYETDAFIDWSQQQMSSALFLWP